MANEPATREEIVAFLTRIMRREETNTMLSRSKEGVELVDVPVRASDAMRAAELLGRHEGLFAEKHRVEIAMPDVEDDL